MLFRAQKEKEMIKINNQYYNITEAEQEVLNRQTGETREFFLDEITKTRQSAWDEVLNQLHHIGYNTARVGCAIIVAKYKAKPTRMWIPTTQFTKLLFPTNKVDPFISQTTQFYKQND